MRQLQGVAQLLGWAPSEFRAATPRELYAACDAVAAHGPGVRGAGI